MKSIMEEASSIMKAIEKGWVQAGKPQEFTIKIFEDAQKNFLGITTKSAKIGIFFQEKPQPAQRQFKPRETQPKAPQPKHRQPPVLAKEPVKQPVKPVEAPVEKKTREVWGQELIQATNSWVKDVLMHMEKPTAFTIDAKNYYLKINFEQPLFEDPEREKLLFRSLAHLIMQTLRNKFKKSFRGFKVILSSTR